MSAPLLIGTALALIALAVVLYPLFFFDADVADTVSNAIATPPTRCPTCGPRPETDATYCSTCGARVEPRPRE